MRGFAVCFSSASSVIRRKHWASESESGQSLIEPAWLSHNAWILLGARIRKCLSDRQGQAQPVRVAAAGR